MIGISFTQKTMAARKRIALVAHDHCKAFLLDWAERQKDGLARHDLVATGTADTFEAAKEAALFEASAPSTP